MNSIKRRHAMSTRCVTCGMKVNRNKAHIRITYKGQSYLACCPLCQSKFEDEPERYISESKVREKG